MIKMVTIDQLYDNFTNMIEVTNFSPNGDDFFDLTKFSPLLSSLLIHEEGNKVIDKLAELEFIRQRNLFQLFYLYNESEFSKQDRLRFYENAVDLITKLGWNLDEQAKQAYPKDSLVMNMLREFPWPKVKELFLKLFKSNIDKSIFEHQWEYNASIRTIYWAICANSTITNNEIVEILNTFEYPNAKRTWFFKQLCGTANSDHRLPLLKQHYPKHKILGKSNKELIQAIKIENIKIAKWLWSISIFNQ